MAITDYIATLENSKTFKDGLISFQEYSKKPKWGGLLSELPDLPRADKYRHVVVMEIRGGQPVVYTTLTRQTHSVNLRSNDAGHFLFIFIEMRPQVIHVEAPPEGFRLADGHRINCTMNVRYQVEDAEVFWTEGMDPLAELEKAVLNAAQNFFFGIMSNQLINEPTELKQSLEQHIKRSEIIIIKGDLEKKISSNCQIDGVKIIEVKADVILSDALKNHLERIHNKVYSEGGIADRVQIDRLIASNKTYSPYNLRDVILALDLRLLENFYTMEWSDAMRKVAEKIAEKKEQNQRSIEDMEINSMKNRIKVAVEYGLDEEDIKDLKEKFSKKLLNFAGGTANTQLPSDREYLHEILGPSSSFRRLESDAKAETSTQDDFQQFLLDSPEMTDEEEKAIKEKRRHFRQWK